MIMGESSYHPKADQAGYDKVSQTINAGDDAIGYDEGRGYWNKSRFYTRISRMFGYEARSFERRKEFWNSVLYYNYLQDVLIRARQEPPANLWIDSQPAFKETLEEYRPDIVISYSKRMWHHLPKDISVVLPNSLSLQCWEGSYTLTDGKKVKMYGFLHPTSRGFSWQTVGQLLNELIPKK